MQIAKTRYTMQDMDKEAILVTLFGLFFLGGAIGFYIASLLL